MSDRADLLAALLPVVEVLDRLRVDYLVGGSVASSVHGMARATMDIDLVADLRAEHVGPLVSSLEGEYYVDADAMHDALRDRTAFNLIHLDSMFKVDIFVPKGRPFDREVLARRASDRFQDTPNAREIFVATAEDVILAKLEWFERGGRISDRQWSDVLGVLRVQGDALDFAYLRRWASELGLTDLLDRALAERDPEV